MGWNEVKPAALDTLFRGMNKPIILFSHCILSSRPLNMFWRARVMVMSLSQLYAWIMCLEHSFTQKRVICGGTL